MTAIPTTAPHKGAHLLAAAGLLHDAGKIGEPAVVPLHPTIEGLEQQACPSDQQWRAQYRHVLFSAQLLHEAQEQGCDFGGLNAHTLFQAVTYHLQRTHDTLEECLLKKADWLASGHDRRRAHPETHEGPITGLWPILRSLDWPPARVKPNADSIQIVPTRRFSLEEDSFLPQPEQDRAAYQKRCREIWSTLRLRRSYDNPANFVEHLSALAERCFHTIPASRQRGQQADVSLCDHSRIVAAFAACLAVLHENGPADPNKLHGKYRLLCIGVGGIQRFLVRSIPRLDAPAGDSGEKGMAKRLRARSFYVSLLSWLVARRVLDAMGMPPVNLLVDAGGRSILLLPDAPTIQGRLMEAIRFVDRWFTQRLGGVLRLDLALSETLDDTAFAEERFAGTFRHADELLAASRFRVPDGPFRKNGDWSDEGWIGDTLGLTIDGRDFNDRMRRLGEQLPKVNYLSLDSETACAFEWGDLLGYRVGLHEHEPSAGRYFSLNTTHETDAVIPFFITANHVPRATTDDLARLSAVSRNTDDSETATEHGALLTFNDLANLSTDDQTNSVRHPMLAALKADVDRLGMLMGYGLGDRVSIGRYASMARTLDLFFKAFLTSRLRARYERVYTVFAGGDDLFLIGPWYDLVRLLGDLKRWFRRLACGNPNVTFSAGLVFAKPGTPVRHLAWHAEESLEAAKVSGRNRVTIVGETMSWSDYDRTLTLHQLMLHVAGESALSDRHALNPSMVYRLLQYGNMGIRGTSPGGARSPTDMKWRAQLSYDLKRNLPEPKDPNSALAEFHASLLQLHGHEDAQVLRAAATLTLYFLRGVA